MDDRSVVLDTNVLLEATTLVRTLHRAARRVLDDWPNRGVRLCVSGQIFREYLVVAIRKQEVDGLGLVVGDALANVVAFAGRCRFLGEDQNVAELLRQLLQGSGLPWQAGPRRPRGGDLPRPRSRWRRDGQARPIFNTKNP